MSASVADLDQLAGLIDDRSGWCEDRRLDDEQVDEACRGKTRSVKSDLREYYEELNYILDGWRRADVVIESEFPAEVMRRFGTVEEVEQALGKLAHLQQPHLHRDRSFDGTMSPRFGRPSLQTKAAHALGLGGFFFSGGGNDSDQNQSGSATPVARLQSEEESGFDSDSEPEPDQVGPGPRRRNASKTNGSNGESQALLGKKKKSLRELQKARRSGNASKPTGDYGATKDGGNAKPSSGGPSGNVSTDTPADGETRNLAATTNTKAASNSGSANEEEDRDQLTALPGGKRERERLALRSAVPGWEEAEKDEEQAVQFAININLLINVLLLAGKAIAVLSSSSVSLLASLVDSALDLLSTLIIFGASKAVAFKSSESYFKYPRGKKSFEPLGVVVFSVLMIASFCQVLVESVERLWQVIQGTNKVGKGNNELPLIGIAFMLATIAIKAVMFVLYRNSRSSGVRAVAQDSQNDVVFNIFSLTFPFFGSALGWPALDPVGGIVLSVYIISEWLSTLVSTTTKLSGARASTADLARVLYLITRFKSVRSVSSCEMYYAGDEIVVEADVVLPVEMPLKAAHDLGEVLTHAIEMMPDIGRAYIHLDYNPSGQPAHISARG